MREEFENLRNAVGGLAELCKMFYDDLLRNGFSEFVALELTKQLMCKTLTGGKE